MKFLAALFLSRLPLLAQATIDPAEVAEVKISYEPWQTVHSTAMNAPNLREKAAFKLTVSTPWDIQALVSNLPLEELKPVAEEASDLRLVLDFQLRSGATMSFVASRFHFYSSDMKTRTRISKQFRQAFSIERIHAFQLHQPNHHISRTPPLRAGSGYPER